jgi:hypothetical protein
MVLFLRLGTDRGIGAELNGTGQEAWGARLGAGVAVLPVAAVRGFSPQLGILIEIPAAPVAVGE